MVDVMSEENSDCWNWLNEEKGNGNESKKKGSPSKEVKVTIGQEQKEQGQQDEQEDGVITADNDEKEVSDDSGGEEIAVTINQDKIQVDTNKTIETMQNKQDCAISLGQEQVLKKEERKFVKKDFDGICTDYILTGEDEPDFDDEEEKPWRKPGTDISDYFNYGFSEDTWTSYCQRQRRLRSNEIKDSEPRCISVITHGNKVNGNKLLDQVDLSVPPPGYVPNVRGWSTLGFDTSEPYSVTDFPPIQSYDEYSGSDSYSEWYESTASGSNNGPHFTSGSFGERGRSGTNGDSFNGRRKSRHDTYWDNHRSMLNISRDRGLEDRDTWYGESYCRMERYMEDKERKDKKKTTYRSRSRSSVARRREGRI